ncbi:MAG TPA: glycosyltransferase family 4 protein [Mycobacteriales bacterium]|nr:glycosyltransferase family 4 protein [Mycobacteriales bacterium]
MRRTLVVTNDFPPRAGGIQAYVHELALRQPPGSVVVFASTSAGAAEFDAAQPFPVVRYPTSMLLPTPAVSRRVQEVARAEGCTAAWFGASAPLALLAPALRRAGVERIVAASHGHEIGWAALPGSRQLLRRIGDAVDVVTYLAEYSHERIASAYGPRPRFEWVPPGVDTDAFRPDVSGAAIRARHGLGDRPTVVCVSRLVPRKGQDTLIRAWSAVRARIPGAVLLIVGEGRDEARLKKLAAGLGDSVVFTGGVPWAELPQHYAAGHVFAMPCRTRRFGWDVEGLGIVYLEASATGLPVIGGDSGGAPDAVLEGETGWVVPGGSVPVAAERMTALLADPDAARAAGEKGRAWVERDWRWDGLAARLGELLQE